MYSAVKQAIIIAEKGQQNPVHSGLTATLCTETETEVSNWIWNWGLQDPLFGDGVFKNV